jgi:hypothetical protein
MATTAHRARDRGASGDRRSLSKAAGIAVRPPGAWGRRPAKPANENGVTTGSDATKPTPTINPNRNPENLPTKGKAKATAKPANDVTTGFGVESTGLEVENPKRIRSASACEPFREAIELGLSRGRDATAIWQDLVAESGFDGGYQTVKRYVRKLRGNRSYAHCSQGFLILPKFAILEEEIHSCVGAVGTASLLTRVGELRHGVSTGLRPTIRPRSVSTSHGPQDTVTQEPHRRRLWRISPSLPNSP